MAGVAVNVTGVAENIVPMVESHIKNMAEKTPPIVQTKKRMRPSSKPLDETDNFEGISDRKMMEEILVTVRNNQKQLVSFEESLSFVHGELDLQKLETQRLTEENAELKLRLDRVEQRLSTVETDLSVQSRMRDESEQNGRMQNLEISGVPKLQGESDDDCKTIVGEVMSLIGSRFGEDDVDVAHRKMAGGIIVRFMSRTVRNEVYLKRFKLVGKKASNIAPRFKRTDGAANEIYINENLSYDRALLMKHCRDRVKPLNAGVGKEQRIKTKTTGGKIKVQGQDGNFVKIKTLGDLDQIYPGE